MKTAVFTTLIVVLTALISQNQTSSPAFAAANVRLYVDADATGSNNGTSWENAYIYLQDALDEANANGSTHYEIWVAEGVYYPDEDSNGDHVNDQTTESFTLLFDNVQMFGGFKGDEISREQRRWLKNKTILSGDLDQNDGYYEEDNILGIYGRAYGNNAAQIISLDGEQNEGISNDTRIDGFVYYCGRFGFFLRGRIDMFWEGD